ncbi:hypothetical protein DFH09DRAFT_1074806 [Mycena vulgaris]|nr:hypothetical protein DFH09DRAFT_1074806 [Mycena vulgaris]
MYTQVGVVPASVRVGIESLERQMRTVGGQRGVEIRKARELELMVHVVGPGINPTGSPKMSEVKAGSCVMCSNVSRSRFGNERDSYRTPSVGGIDRQESDPSIPTVIHIIWGPRNIKIRGNASGPMSGPEGLGIGNHGRRTFEECGRSTSVHGGTRRWTTRAVCLGSEEVEGAHSNQGGNSPVAASHGPLKPGGESEWHKRRRITGK